MKNYLPIVLRETFPLGSGANRSLRIMSAVAGAAGRNARVIYEDCTIWLPIVGGNVMDTFGKLRCRIGLDGLGYLTEEPQPCGVQMNSHRPWESCWRLKYPYRLPAAHRMHVTNIEPMNVRAYQPAGVLFSCVREKDGRPAFLYDSMLDIASAGSNTYDFNSATMTAPADSALLIHSVSYSRTQYRDDSVSAQLQIRDAFSREWFVNQTDPAAQTLLVAGGIPDHPKTYWLNPIQSPIELGEERGWAAPAHMPFLMEYENDNTVEVVITTTIRAYIEVDE